MNNESNNFKITVSKSLIDSDVLTAVLYKMLHFCDYKIEEVEHNYNVSLFFKSTKVINDIDEFHFNNLLIEEQIRKRLNQRYGRIREIIVKHAFSQVDLKSEIEYDG